MKYYIGYFNKPWDKSEFTVLCACPNRSAASFILSQYKKQASDDLRDVYILLTAAEIMDKTLVL